MSQDSLSWSVWYQSDFKWNHSLPSLSPKRSLHWPWRNLPCPLIGKLYVIAIIVHWNWSQMTKDGPQTEQFLSSSCASRRVQGLSNTANLPPQLKVAWMQAVCMQLWGALIFSLGFTSTGCGWKRETWGPICLQFDLTFFKKLHFDWASIQPGCGQMPKSTIGVNHKSWDFWHSTIQVIKALSKSFFH